MTLHDQFPIRGFFFFLDNDKTLSPVNCDIAFISILTYYSDKNQIIVRKNISETRDGSLYLWSNETRRCLIKGSIKSARILEQVNMTFTVSGRKSRLCTGIKFCLNLTLIMVIMVITENGNILLGLHFTSFVSYSFKSDCIW